MDDNLELQELNAALAGLESSAANFGIRFAADANVRADYNKQTKKLTKEILNDVSSGKLTPFQGAKRASEMRNIIMDALRGKSSEIGRAYAFSHKAKGKSLMLLEQKYAKKLFRKSFEKLSSSQKSKVWKEVVFAAGRPQAKANKLAKVLGHAGKGLIALTLTISIYNIATAEDKLQETGRTGAVLGGGLLGSIAGGATAGLACGPGAPVCVGIGIFVGSVMFAIGSEMAYNSFWN